MTAILTLPAVARLALSVALMPITIALYRLFLHPLAGIPGPKLAAVTSLWNGFQARRGKLFALELHRMYGPMVRIGPNEVMFNSMEAYDAIYCAGSSFAKADYYWSMKFNSGKVSWTGQRYDLPDEFDLLPEMDMQRYKLQRRLVGPPYATTQLKRYEASVDRALDKFTAKVDQFQGEEIDALVWSHMLGVEAMSGLVLSQDLGLMEKGDDDGWIRTGYHRMWRFVTVMGNFPQLVLLCQMFKTLYRILPRVLLGLPPMHGGGTFVWQQLYPAVNARFKEYESDKDCYKSRRDLMDDFLAIHDQKPEFKKEYAEGIALTNFGAGHDTVASSLTTIFAFLGQQPPHVMQRIREEIKDLSDHPTYDECTSLEYTMACIKEAMRLIPVLGVSLPRVSHAQALDVHGRHIPPGTVVGSNPFAMHRNRQVYGEDADQFRAERWLGCTDAQLKLMTRASMVWGTPNRTCPGRHLGELIVYKLVPALLKRYDIETSKIGNIDDIEVYFFSTLTDVRIRFKPRKG